MNSSEMVSSNPTIVIADSKKGDLVTKKSKCLPIMGTVLKLFVLSLMVFTALFVIRVNRPKYDSVLRFRSLLAPPPRDDALYDYDMDEEHDATDEPPPAAWGPWGKWSRCSSGKYCAEGSQFRKRKCVTSNNNGFCTGISMESRDCPGSSCSRDNHRTPGLADESPAPETSFIGQECNSSTKYFARGKEADKIPEEVFHLFPAAKRLFTSGFFAVQEIPKVLPREDNITKICFEPLGLWNIRSIRKALHLNRYTKASIKNLNSKHLLGIAIGLKLDGTLYAVQLAIGTPGAMYSTLYYRRFRGRSFHEDYVTY
ncbi:uncharacterized protein LOC110235953 [Exaiptasia diaphana]|uniref:Uncharacterized protein n=1 Tax=Exaiptasia diaphana TaxID=2652724 RepID=A0A913X0Q6_EXADI|nr:uncharacterized protein LOC110235953 [Exaiptasia diaphana]